MSGQPYRTSYDIANAREAYLANLKLRAELDDKNLQANKMYIKTGQLPVEPTDTRTVSEKLADVERLKIDIRGKLLEITDGVEAAKIAASLSPDQLLFLSQQWGPISEQMKETYSIGVLAEIFLNFLNKYIEKYNITGGVEFNLQQAAGNQLLANQKTIMRQMANKQNIDDIIRTVKDLGISQSSLGININNNLRLLMQIIDILPETFSDIQKENNAIQKSQLIEVINNIVRELPTKTDIEENLNQLDRATTMKDTDEIYVLIQKLEQLTSLPPDVVEQLTILREVINSKVPLEPKPSERQEDTQLIYKSSNELQTSDVITIKQYLKVMSNKIIYDEKGRRTDRLDGFKSLDSWLESIYGVKYNRIDKPNLLNAVARINNKLAELEGLQLVNGAGMKGKGIAIRKRPSEVLPYDVDHSLGIKETPKFVPIGRYLINKRQLDKDIIAIKRKAGSTIATLPSTRVSRNFGSVMRKIIGGSLPSFEELNSLSDEERVYLHKVAKETHIDDKISIPTPKKDEDEKDINQFEILKGQILSGNDNAELVKKFKTIILKLSKKDLIPKAQVKDLLLDLATLGH